MSKKDMSSVWEDREVRFDCHPKEISLRKGEFEIDVLNSIEDTKGNNGEKGKLVITNLRMIWISLKSVRVNLSVGYNCIINLTTQTANSRLRGHTQALFVLTRFNDSRFEFIFTNLVKNNPRLFSSVQSVFKSYESSKLYRDLRLRAAIIRNKELLLLPKENVIRSVKGVWNLSRDQGNLGSFVLTNVRVVWFADLAENFNVSIPYLQMKKCRIRNSKFGSAFVIETSSDSGGYILGFRVDPKEEMERVFKEVNSLNSLYSNNPVFGIEYEVQEQQKTLKERTIQPIQDEVQIIQDQRPDPLVKYFADGENKKKKKEIVFSQELGLSMEKLIDGVSLDELWNVIIK